MGMIVVTCAHAETIPDVQGSPILIIIIEIRSSCEIEYFVQSHLCKLCVVLRSRVQALAFGVRQ